MTLEEQQERFVDIMREASFAHWNALLSLNGILISVFSAVAIFGKTNIWLTLCLVMASMISCWFLIHNFKREKAWYKMLGEMGSLPTIEERKKITEEAEAEPAIIKRNERIVESLLFIQGLIILLILLSGYIFQNTFLFFGNKPERFSVYQSLLDNEEKVQVAYVGKNWEIKDAVKEIGDSHQFHTKSFWAHKNDKLLVVCVSYRRQTIKIHEQDVDLGAIVYVVPLDQFSKEYKPIKPD